MKKVLLGLMALVLSIFTACTLRAQYFPGGLSKSSINLWYDAADTATLTTVSGAISSWADKANGLNAAQTVTTARPVLSTYNGQNIVEFNGSKGLNIADNPLLLPSKGFVLAQAMHVYSNAPTTLTDSRVGMFSTDQANTTGSPYVSTRYYTSLQKYVPGDNVNNHVMSIYGDMRGQSGILDNYVASANNVASWFYNGAGNLSERFTSPILNYHTQATIGNECSLTGNNNYQNVHWGVNETVLVGADLQKSGRVILEHYLAAKWGLLDTLQSYVGNVYFYPTDNSFVQSLVGIGYEGGNDSITNTGSNNGLALQNVSGTAGFLRQAGDYLMAADNGLTGATALGTGFSRWNRSWFVDKTDVSGYGGLVNLVFDFDSYGIPTALDTVNNQYYILYNPTNGYYNSDSNHLVSINGFYIVPGTHKLSFSVDALNIANGYYTILYAPRGTPVSTIPNLAQTLPIVAMVSPAPNVTVFAGNTFNYILFDSSVLNYPVAYYKIYVRTGSDTTLRLLDSTIGTPKYYAHYSLNNDTVYTYYVSAVYAAGKESVLSASVNGIPGLYPPQWLIAPQYSTAGQIFMSASVPLAGLPLEYYFENVSGGGHSSTYQVSPAYTDSLLIAGNTYSYHYKLIDTTLGVSFPSGWSATQTVLIADSAMGGYTYNMGYLDPSTIYAPYGIGPSTTLPSQQDMTGIRYLKHVPAIGIHPRVYCNPEDSTEIRNRLKNTYSGKAAAKWIHAFTTLLQVGYSGYNKNADYNKDAMGNQYIQNVGAEDVKSLYDSLAAGDIGITNNYSNYFGGNTAKMAYFFSHEAMECWLYRGQYDSVTKTSYTTRAAKLARALGIWGAKAAMDTNLSYKNPMNFGGLHMALAYDFLFDQMTKGQQDSVRMGIMRILPDSSFEHGFQTPSYTITTNWATFGGEIFTNIAVEGEPGYATKDSGLLRNWIRSVWNFVTYGIYDKTGDMYEGLGKNRINAPLLVAMAKRGYSVLGHPSIRAYAQKYLPAVIQPFGYSSVGTDILGGTGFLSPSTGGWNTGWLDPGGLKWAFPTDTAVDLVWKNLMQRPYANAPYDAAVSPNFYFYTNQGDNYGAGFNTRVPALIFASDYFNMPLNQQFQSALGNNKMYFDSLGGQAVLRSGFDSTSTMVFFANRQDGGGHTYANKNELLLSALGRIWIPRVTTTSSGAVFNVISTSQVSSMVLVNDLAVSADTGNNWSVGIVPAKMVYYNNSPSMLSIAGDATKAYSYQWRSSSFGGLSGGNPALNPPYVNKVTDYNNLYRYSPYYSFDNVDYYDRLAFTDQPTPPYYYFRTVERPYLNGILKKVFRTVSLVQAKNPYVLVADDVQKDNNVNNYKWVCPIAQDLTLDTTYVNLNNTSYQFDAILAEPSTTGNRRLLVRVLNINGPISNKIVATIDSSIYAATNSCQGCGLRRFKIESNSIDPQFKVMLFAFQKGDSLPVTTWSPDKSKVYVSNAGVNNVVSFILDSAGRTNILLNSPDTGMNWTGAVDTNWHNPGNWSSNRVPTDTDYAIIPSIGVTNMPVISQSIAYSNKIAILTGATLTVDSVLQLSGDMNLLGTLNGPGTVKTYSHSNSEFPLGLTWNVNIEYNRAAGGQNIVGGTYKNLSINASLPTAPSTAGGNLNVNGVMNISSGNTLNMVAYTLGGTVKNITGTGLLQTQSQATTCLPKGAIWKGGVVFNSLSGGQFVPTGTYQNLYLNTVRTGTVTAAGNISIVDTLNIGSKTTFDLSTYLLGGSIHDATGTGLLKTADTLTAGPIPSNGNWPFTVTYYSANKQTVVQGIYTNLDLSGGSKGNRSLGGVNNPTGLITVSGDLTPTTGTVTPYKSTVLFNGNQQVVPAMPFYNLDLTGSFATSFANGIIAIYGNFNPANITTANGVGTFNFTGTGIAQTIPTFNYNNLTISGARNQDVTIGNQIGVSGNLSYQGLSFNTGTLKDSATTFTFNGNIPQSFDAYPTSVASFVYNNIIITNRASTVSPNSNVVINGSLEIAPRATFDLASNVLSGNFTMPNDSTNGGILKTQYVGASAIPSGKSYTGTVSYYSKTGAQSIVPAYYNNLDLSGGTTGGRILPNAGTLYISGNLYRNTGTGALVSTNNTVVFNGKTSINDTISLNNVVIRSNDTLIAPSTLLNISGNFTDSGLFNANNGSIVLNGTGQYIFGNNTFNNFTKTTTTPDTLTFSSSTTQNITGNFVLSGKSGSLLTVLSSTPAAQAIINPSGLVSVNYVAVRDNLNINPASIHDYNGQDMGNNVNWDFGTPSSYTWTGAVDNKWSNPANWSTAKLPGAFDTAVIAKTGANDLTLDVSPNIYYLTINIGNVVSLSNQTLTLSHDLNNNGTLKGDTLGSISFAGHTQVLGTGTNNWGNVSINAHDTLVAPNANINIYGDWVNNGVFMPSTGTITFVGKTQHISTTTFNNLTIDSGTSISTGIISIPGTLLINNGALFNLDTNKLSVVGTIKGTGTLTTKSTSLSPIPIGKTWTCVVSYNNPTGGQQIVAGTYQNGLNTFIDTNLVRRKDFAGGNLIVNGNLSITDSLDMLTNTLKGSFTPVYTSGILLTQANSPQFPYNISWPAKVVYNSTATQSIISGTYQDLDASKGGQKRLTDNTGAANNTITINGNFNILDGTNTVPNVSTVIFNGKGRVVPAINYYNLTIADSTATFGAYPNPTVNIAGQFTPGPITVVNPSTIAFNGSSSQTIPAINYYNLSISGTRSAGSQLTLSPGTLHIRSNITDKHNGTFSSLIATNDTLLISNTLNFAPKPDLQTGWNILATDKKTVSLATNLSINGLYLTGGGVFVDSATSLTILGNSVANGGGLASFPTATVNYYQPTNGQNVLTANYGKLAFNNFNKVLPSVGIIGIADSFYTGTATGHTIVGSTIDFNGTDSQFVPSFSYYNLLVTGGRNQGVVTFAPAKVYVAGNYTRNANFSVGGGMSFVGDTLVLNGTGSQALYAANNENFNNVTINNITAGDSIVLQQSNFSISGNLNFVKGLLSIANSHLTLGNTATVTGASTQSHIVTTGKGKVVRRVTNTPQVFPVGTATSYTPITLTNTAGSANDSVQVGTTISNPVPDSTKLVNLQWSVTSNGFTTATATFGFDSTDGAVNFVPTQSCELGDFTTAYIINPVGLPTALGGGNYTVTKTGITFSAGVDNLLVVGNVGSISSSCVTGTYVGSNGGDASLPVNWCNGLVPNATTNAIIANNVPKLSQNFFVNNLQITSGLNLNGYTLTVNGIVSGTGGITGSKTSGLVLNGNGTVHFDTSKVGITNVLNTLTIKTSGKDTLGTNLILTGFLNPTNGTLALGNNNITLHSDSAGTAQVGTVNKAFTFNYNGTGRFIAERYLNNSQSGYRNVASNGILTDSSIFQNWQENGLTPNGYGIQITGETASVSGIDPITGIDYTLSGSPSLFTYSNTDALVAVTNTKATQLMPFVGYEAYVRGDRNYGLYNPFAKQDSAATTLRTNGKIVYGQVQLSSKNNPIWLFSASVPSTFKLNKSTVPVGKNPGLYGYSLIANPYTCAVNWKTVYARSVALSTNRLSKYYWVWNQAVGKGTGGFVTVDSGGLGSVQTDKLLTTNDNWLQPGQSFFIANDHSGGDITVDFEETDKWVSSNVHIKNVFATPTIPNYIKFGLNRINTTDTLLVDGAVVKVDSTYLNAIDINDAAKMENPAENLAVYRQGRQMAIENRSLPTTNDTIPLQIWNVTLGNTYVLNVDASHFTTAKNPYVYDLLTFAKTPITIGGTTQVAFAPTADTLTFKNRFLVLFSDTVVLPVTFNSISAEHKGSSNIVHWDALSPVGSTKFVVEHSNNGKDFDRVGDVAIKSFGSDGLYVFIDANPYQGDNYYRVRLVTPNGDVFSKSVLVSWQASSLIHLYPTHITDNHCFVQLQNLPKGDYLLELFSSNGEVVSKQNIVHNGGSAVYNVQLSKSQLASGVYEARVVNGNNIFTVQKLEIE